MNTEFKNTMKFFQENWAITFPGAVAVIKNPMSQKDWSGFIVTKRGKLISIQYSHKARLLILDGVLVQSPEGKGPFSAEECLPYDQLTFS